MILKWNLLIPNGFQYSEQAPDIVTTIPYLLGLSASAPVFHLFLPERQLYRNTLQVKT